MEKISSTRIQLLLLRQRILVTQKGLALLESKREALVKEFFKMVESATTARKDLRLGMQKAQNSLMLALGQMGREPLASAAFPSRRNLALELQERNVWGVRFPDLHFQTAVRAPDARGYSLTSTSPHLDETACRFEEVMDLVLKTVSVEMKLKRIGQEVKKVTRRINALKEIILPPMRVQVREVKTSLEEREHEDIFRIKRFKNKWKKEQMAGL